jgi:hypothetical protein
MINNHEVIPDAFKCNKKLADYLIYTGHLPLLSISEKNYYFAKTYSWAKAMTSLPKHMKILMKVGFYKI